MRSLIALFFLLTCSFTLKAQISFGQNAQKEERKAEKRKKINALIRQAEEGTLVYTKHNLFGFQARSNGYGLFYELGKAKTPLKNNLYRFDLTEIKNEKENKFQNLSNPFLFISNPYVYGKVNNFYQASFSVGQQRLLGQKGNKNGVAVSLLYQGGLSLGLLKPYYVEVEDPNGPNTILIKYSSKDSILFLGPAIMGAGGFWRGWNELKIKPGGFVKTSLRFDYGRFNEVVSALDVGCSAEYFAGNIPIMALQKNKSLFFQAHIALVFGRRK